MHTLTLTPQELQALADLMDRECRMNGLQASMVYGPIACKIVDTIHTATPETDGN